MITVKREIGFVRRPDKSHAIVAADGNVRPSVPAGRVPRISRLMALAIHFDRLIRDGTVADLSTLARLAHVTQPRITQIMNLNHLAPDIQEELLKLPGVARGRDRIHERLVRPIAGEPHWRLQRRLWMQVRSSHAML